MDFRVKRDGGVVDGVSESCECVYRSFEVQVFLW